MIFTYNDAHETQYLVLFINIHVALQIYQFLKFVIHIFAEKKNDDAENIHPQMGNRKSQNLRKTSEFNQLNILECCKDRFFL